jgi:Na+/melibiose symporter-like transporter
MSELNLRQRLARGKVYDQDSLNGNVANHPPSTIASTTLFDVKFARSKLYAHVNSKVGRLSSKIRILFSSMQVALEPVSTLLVIYTPTFYQNLGASFHYIAFFVAVTRSVDIILDPFISYSSDSFRGPFGRRRPFIFVGCFLYALTLIMYLSPPSNLGEISLAIWFGITSMSFFISNSFTSIPYHALGMELSSSYHDRTLLYYTSAMCEFLGSICLIGLSQLLYNNSTVDSECSSSSCYDSSGVSKACLANFTNDEKTQYSIFDVYSYNSVTAPNSILGFNSNVCLQANGSIYTNPQHLFYKQKCNTLVPSLTNPSKLESITEHTRWTSAQLSNYNTFSWEERNTQCLQTYCECVHGCSEMCNIRGTLSQYSQLSIIVGMFFIVSACLLVYNTRERVQMNSSLKHTPKPSPVSAMVNTLRNIAFRSMLPTFVCDKVAYSIVTTTMLFFVKYIIQPELQKRSDGDSIDCNQGVPITDHESSSWRCNTNNVLGAVLVVMLSTGFISCTFWYFVTIRFGKRNTWVGWSIIMILSLLFLLLVDKGDVNLSLYLSVIPGFAIGARFIGMSILADVIEYGEYISGQRNEASYIMIKNLLSKLAIIPVVSIPLVVVNSLEPYSTEMKTAIYIMIVVIPVVLLLISIIYKFSMPLAYKEQCELIADGIGLHLLGKESPDPISGNDYIYPVYTNAEQRKIDVMDHFPTVDDALTYQNSLDASNVFIGVAMLIERARDQTVWLFILLVCFITGVAVTWNLFSEVGTTIYPMMLSICSAVVLLFLILSFLRLRASIKLKRKEFRISKVLIKKIIEKRELDRVMAQSDAIDIVGISESLIKLRMRLKSRLQLNEEEYEALITANNEDTRDAHSDSDEDYDHTSTHNSTSTRSDINKTVTKRGTMVVDHWRAIINMKTAEDLTDIKKKEEELLKKQECVVIKNFASIIQDINDKIAQDVSIADDFSITQKYESHKPVGGAANRKISDSDRPKNKYYMTDSEYPTAWDMEFHTFVKNQDALNRARTMEEIMADISNSAEIGKTNDEYLSNSDHDSDSTKSTESSKSKSVEDDGNNKAIEESSNKNDIGPESDTGNDN